MDLEALHHCAHLATISFLAYSGDLRTMELQPSELHQRVPVLLGSPDEVESVRRLLPL